MSSLRIQSHTRLLQSLHNASPAIDKYKLSFWTIMNFAGQMSGYKLPGLNYASNWPGGAKAYAQTQAAWSQATGQLQGWADSTLSNLVALPTYLINSGQQVVSPGLASSVSLAGQLINDPTNNFLKSTLLNNLSGLSTSFTQYSSRINTIVISLQSEATEFDKYATLMQQISVDALKTAGNAKQTIIEANAKIEALRKDITTQAWTIAGGSIATIAGIGMGILGIFLAPVTGGMSLALLVPAALIGAGGVYIITLAAQKIVADKAAIDLLLNQIDSTNQDIVALNSMSGTLKGFSDQMDSLKSDLSNVVAPWLDAKTYIDQTNQELINMENASSSDWQAVQTELMQIQTSWGSFEAIMAQLKADASVAPTSGLTVGMDENQVRAAMANSPKVPIAQYIAF